MNLQELGNQIAILRRQKGLTQNDLGERLGVSFQAVSKWERGETAPDVLLLPDLAEVLETTVDYILNGGKKTMSYRGTITVSDMIQGIQCLGDMGKYLGKDNLIYRHAIRGINEGMNIDVEEAFSNDFIFECLVAEAIIQNLKSGDYVDITDVKRNFKSEHFRQIVLDYCERYGIR